MPPAFCSAEQLADHRHDLQKHDPRPIDQRTAVAKLVGYCEGLCKSGALTEFSEKQLRLLVVETLSAFEMPTQAERSPS